MALPEKAFQYFSSINTMANRLCIDLNEATKLNKNILENLPLDEQQQLLHDAIVTPQVLMKYPQQQDANESPTKYAVKMIVDDHYSYRDEHSGPFSFHTASQRELSCVTRKKHAKKPAPKYKAPAPPVPPVKALKTVITAEVDENNEEVLRAEQIEVREDFDRQLVEDIDDIDGLSSLIPKTGLDLLDNW